jgi:hypothetical protein
MAKNTKTTVDLSALPTATQAAIRNVWDTAQVAGGISGLIINLIDETHKAKGNILDALEVLFGDNAPEVARGVLKVYKAQSRAVAKALTDKKIKPAALVKNGKPASLKALYDALPKAAAKPRKPRQVGETAPAINPPAVPAIPAGDGMALLLANSRQYAAQVASKMAGSKSGPRVELMKAAIAFGDKCRELMAAIEAEEKAAAAAVVVVVGGAK